MDVGGQFVCIYHLKMIRIMISDLEHHSRGLARSDERHRHIEF
jgi:hypothetical protein